MGPFGVVSTGDPFDDGAFEGVRTVAVYTDCIGITGIEIQYVAKEKFHIRVHGFGNNINPMEPLYFLGMRKKTTFTYASCFN